MTRIPDDEFQLVEKQVETSIVEVHSHMVQHGSNNTLFLTPNEVFFDPPGILQNVVKPNTLRGDGDALNAYLEFDHITQIRKSNHWMSWGVTVDQDVTITVKICMTPIPRRAPNSFIFTWIHSSTQFECVPSNTLYASEFTIRLTKGLNELGLALAQSTEFNTVGKLRYIKLASPTPCQLDVVRLRWRPAAHHFKWTSSNATKKQDAWAIGIKGHQIPHQVYAPITTPFGYFGFILNPDFTATHSINFSMWGPKPDPVPPRHTLPRLLAIGDPTATFSAFSHEGYGVNVRKGNKKIWAGNTSMEYILGMRVEEEPTLVFEDGRVLTYYGYTWDESTNSWNLFAVGQQFLTHKKAKKGIPATSFLEVIGGPETNRTGDQVRAVSFKGYTRNADTKKWVFLDEMPDLIPRVNSLTSHKRKVEDDRFVASHGGYSKKRKTASMVHTLSTPVVIPAYLQHIDQLEQMVVFPSIRKVQFKSTMVWVKVRLPRNAQGKNKVILYFGKQDGYSLDKEWESKYEHGVLLKSGRRTIKIPYHALQSLQSGQYRMRLFVRNSAIQMWSKHVFSVTR